MFERQIQASLLASVGDFPATGILGSRQVGKTTLAKRLITAVEKPSIYLDLERPSDIARLQNAEYFFESNQSSCIVLDEIQRMPELFPTLRSSIDAHRVPGRFILLGSSSPELLRTSAESLAGRIDYHELAPLLLSEVKDDYTLNQHWMAGGYPDALLAKSVGARTRWHRSFVRTYIERDLPALGLNTTALDLHRLLSMIAHEQGQPENDSKLASALGVKSPTVKRALDFMEQAYLIRRLPAWFTNAKKRLVKSPRLYFKDTGLLHHILNIETHSDLLGHPVAGFSFEGYCIAQITAHPTLSDHQFYYYRTQDGTELDLLAVKANQVQFAFEFKMSSNPEISKGLRLAMEDLKPKNTFIVTQTVQPTKIEPNLFITNIQDLIERKGLTI